MTNLDRVRIAFFLCLSVTFIGVTPVVSGQALSEQEQELLEESFSLDPESILGEVEAEEKELPSLLEKSTNSDLAFLNKGKSPATLEQLKAMQKHVASLYEQVEPAVVNIQSGMGQGSGVVVTSDGYILTAAHVISIPNRPAMITFPDGTRARAQTLGLLRTLDAGLLKIYAMAPKKDSSDDESDADEKESEAEETEEESSDDEEESEDGDEQEEEPKEDKVEAEDADVTEDNDDAEEDSDEEDSDESEEPAEEGDSEDEEEGDSEEESDSEDEDESDSEEAEEETKKKPKTKKNPFAVQDDLPSFDYLEIGDSAELNLGQWVLAVGHPGGLDKDRGIVLRVGRINSIDAEADNAYLRTDCTLVGGDSGGPLISMDGSVIGIHSRIGQRLKQNFHVPANDFVDNWSDLMLPMVHDRDARLSIGFRGKTNVIAEVPRPSMAARSGLKTSDRIIRVGDQEVYDKLQFDDAVSKLKPFQKVEFEIQRRGKKQVIEVTMGEKRESSR